MQVELGLLATSARKLADDVGMWNVDDGALLAGLAKVIADAQRLQGKVALLEPVYKPRRKTGQY